MLPWTSLVFILVEIFRQCVSGTTTEGFQKVVLDSMATTSGVTITSPGFESGSYPTNTRYKWEFITLEKMTIRLSFDVFELESHPYCNWDYIVISSTFCNQSSKSPTDRVCGTKINWTFSSSVNVLCVEFVSDVAITKRGFKAIAEIIEDAVSLSNGQTTLSSASPFIPTYPSSITTNKGQSPSTSVTSSASTTSSTHSTSGASSKSTPTAPSSLTSSPNPALPTFSSLSSSGPKTIFSPSTTGHLSASTSPISSAISTSSPTGLISSTVTSTIKQPNQFSNTDLPKSSTSSSLNTSTMYSTSDLLVSSSVSMTATTVIHYDNPQAQDKPIVKLPVKDVTMIQGNIGEIDVEQYSEIHIKTPKDETGKYPVNFESQLVIKNSESLMMSFAFDSFKIEYHPHCSWDYLTIKHGQGNHPVCGTVPPIPFDSDSELIRIEFHSDFVFPEAGFQLRITIHHPLPSTAEAMKSSTTSSTVTPSSIIGSSTNTTPTTATLKLTTITSQDNQSADTMDSSVSGTSSTEPVSSSSNSPSTAHSPSTATLNGTQAASTEFTDSSSESKTTADPATKEDVYTSDSTSVSATESLVTSSTSNQFKESTTDLMFSSKSPSSLTVPNGYSGLTSSESIQTASPSSVVSTSGSTSTENSGLSEVTVCDYNDIHVGHFGELVVKSPRDDNGKYPVNVHCKMNIRNLAKKNLMIKFTEFRLEQNSNCDWDYLIVYTPDKHGPLCGHHPPSEMVTQSDTIKIEFRSDAVIPDTGFIMKMAVLQDNTSPTPAPVIATSSVTPKHLKTSIGMTSTNTLASSTKESKPFTDESSTTPNPTPPGLSTLTTGSTHAVQSTSASTSSVLTAIHSSTVATSAVTTQPKTSTASLLTSSTLTLGTSLVTSTESVKHTSSSITNVDLEIIDICSRDTLEFNDNKIVVSPGFTNGDGYPLNIECNLAVLGLPGEVIILTINNFDVERSSKCQWDFLSFTFEEKQTKLCGYIPVTFNDKRPSPCDMGTFVQFEGETNTSPCFLDGGLTHTFVFTSDEPILIRFTSDHIVARSGFKLSLKRTKQSSDATLPTTTVLNKQSESAISVPNLVSQKTDVLSTSSQISITKLPALLSTQPQDSSKKSSDVQTSTSSSESVTTTSDVVILVPYKDGSHSSVFTGAPPQSEVLNDSTGLSLSKPTKSMLSSSTATSKPSQTSSTSLKMKDVTEHTLSYAAESSSSRDYMSSFTSSNPNQNTDTSPVATKTSTSGTLSMDTSTNSEVRQSTTESTLSTSPSTDDDLPPACSSNGEPYSLSDDMGFIESPRFGDEATYPPNITCRWKIEDLKGQMISLIFEAFDIEPSSDCRWDKLSIYKTYTSQDKKPIAVLCGSDLPQTITVASDVLIEFKSDSQGEQSGFRLKFLKKHKAYEDQKLNCLPGMTACLPTKSCIPVEWICDGEIDCPDKSDEIKCATCQNTEFSCGGGICVNQTKRCDGHNDCPYGIDEQDCVYMEDDDHVTVIANGTPLPLCYSESVLANGNLVCRETLSRLSTDVHADYDGGAFPSEMAVMSLDQSSSPAFMKSKTCESASTTRVTCIDNNCGRKVEQRRRKRVIGGSFSKQGEWPWTVALRVGKDFSHVICGGTIIDKGWVLTAGHCVKDLTKNPQIASILAGVKNIYDVSAQIRYVTEVVLHPEYHYIFNADIALLKLDRPLIFNEHVQQICLPWDRRQLPPSSRCYIAGWGISDMANYYTTVSPKFLRHAKTKLVSLGNCNSSYVTHSDIDVKIHENMICAGYSSGAIDACKGDSGGGLMCEIADGRWLQVGVTSWGDLCGSTKKPGVYTRVASFVGWINETLGVKGNHNVNCTFETSDWCGYQALSNGTYIWTRKPVDKGIPGQMLFAIRADAPDSSPANATLITPQFSSGQTSCLGFQFLFSGNSNITLSVYGIKEDHGPKGGDSIGTLLWQITSHYPATENWQTSEAEVPSDVTRLMFVSLHAHGGISGLGLDNMTLSPTVCNNSNFIKCNFNAQNLCGYTSPLNTVFNKQWKIKRRGKDKDYVLETGGNYSTYGYMALSQLVSPLLTSSFASLPHCLKFSFFKAFDTPNELKVVTYSKIGHQLTNQRVFWSSRDAVIAQWNPVTVSIFKMIDNFDHIVLEVRRSTFDDIYFMVDDLDIYDGYCV